MKRWSAKLLPLVVFGVLGVLLVAALSTSLNARTTGTPPRAAGETVDVDLNALEEILVKGLKAVRKNQKEFIGEVIEGVEKKTIRVRTVYTAFRYARKRAPFYPFPYFEHAIETLLGRQIEPGPDDEDEEMSQGGATLCPGLICAGPLRAEL